MKPLLLDLFCGQGGAAMGYHNSGFNIIGIDIQPQPLYPFPMITADALTLPVNLNKIDAIHASPPCQSYSTMSNKTGSKQLRLIEQTRQLLNQISKPYVIENVTGARKEMPNAQQLHGGQFDLNIYRPRLFETNWNYLTPPKSPKPKNPLAIYGHHEQKGRVVWVRKDGTKQYAATLEEARQELPMPWANWNGVKEAIPPCYTEHIGQQLLKEIKQ